MDFKNRDLPTRDGMNAQRRCTMDARLGFFREQRIFGGVPNPGVCIQNDQGALSHCSSMGEIKSSWKRMLPFKGFRRAVFLGTYGEISTTGLP
jgi:hypothetical protein